MAAGRREGRALIGPGVALLCCLVSVAAAVLLTLTASANPGVTTKIGEGAAPAISGNGRYVAFWSDAANLVPGDTNNNADVFVYDRQTGGTTRVSVDSAGGQANGDSGSPFVGFPAISGDGRFVAFGSSATNLVSGDTNGWPDAFVHDRDTGATTRVSVDSAGAQADRGGGHPAISDDGRYVAFPSSATNLVTGGDADLYGDVFVHDRQTGATTRVSVDSLGGELINRTSGWPDISSDGRFVAFQSYLVSKPKQLDDIFVHDRQTGTTTMVSVASDGTPANWWARDPKISGDGRFVAFYSSATNLIQPVDPNGSARDVFVHDRQTGVTTVEVVEIFGDWPNGGSEMGDISDDGRYVTFFSGASNLVADDTNGNDVFIRDREAQTTTRASVDSSGAQLPDGSLYPTISDDGRLVAFQYCPRDLSCDGRAPSDMPDILVYDRLAVPTPTPTPTPTSTPTPATSPTRTPTPTPTATPTPTPRPAFPPRDTTLISEPIPTSAPEPTLAPAGTPTPTPAPTPELTATAIPPPAGGAGGPSPGGAGLVVGGVALWAWLALPTAGAVLSWGGLGGWLLYRRLRLGRA